MVQLHTGIGAGDMKGIYVGGVGGNWEFYVAGVCPLTLPPTACTRPLILPPTCTTTVCEHRAGS